MGEGRGHLAHGDGRAGLQPFLLLAGELLGALLLGPTSCWSPSSRCGGPGRRSAGPDHQERRSRRSAHQAHLQPPGRRLPPRICWWTPRVCSDGPQGPSRASAPACRRALGETSRPSGRRPVHVGDAPRSGRGARMPAWGESSMALRKACSLLRPVRQPGGASMWAQLPDAPDDDGGGARRGSPSAGESSGPAPTL